MDFQEERELFEKLTADKSKLVFWKRDIAYQDDRGIVTEERWTTSENYLVGDRLYKIGSNEFLCNSWIDEKYLNNICDGKNLVILEE